jgi:hypothetical protein
VRFLLEHGENGQEREGELDGLVIYEDVAFLVEAKAGAFPLKARRGYDRAIVENLKTLVTEAEKFPKVVDGGGASQG